jgi:hypothetical protein
VGCWRGAGVFVVAGGRCFRRRPEEPAAWFVNRCFRRGFFSFPRCLRRRRRPLAASRYRPGPGHRHWSPLRRPPPNQALAAPSPSSARTFLFLLLLGESFPSLSLVLFARARAGPGAPHWRGQTRGAEAVAPRNKPPSLPTRASASDRAPPARPTAVLLTYCTLEVTELVGLVAGGLRGGGGGAVCRGRPERLWEGEASSSSSPSSCLRARPLGTSAPPAPAWSQQAANDPSFAVLHRARAAAPSLGRRPESLFFFFFWGEGENRRPAAPPHHPTPLTLANISLSTTNHHQ